jgi:fibronectin type 3 domain-containing protein
VGDEGFSKVASVPASRTEYTDAGLGDGVTFHYRLTSIDGDGLESAPSTLAVASTRPRPPAPRDVTVQPDGTGVLVRWRPAPPPAGISRYRVLRIGRLGGAKPLVEVTGTVARDAEPAMRYAVVAIDVEGLESVPSEGEAPE